MLSSATSTLFLKLTDRSTIILRILGASLRLTSDPTRSRPSFDNFLRPDRKNFVRVLNGFLLVWKTTNRHPAWAMTELRRRLGRTLKQLRRERGITQQELANKAGLHRTYLSDMERGSRNPSLTSLERVAAALDFSLSEVFKHAEQTDADRPTATQVESPDTV
jgi:DNA-binding XRE family transcriptional regulator